MHEDFYRFVGNTFDKPRFTLHYRADAPMDIRALFYFPESVSPSKEPDLAMCYIKVCNCRDLECSRRTERPRREWHFTAGKYRIAAASDRMVMI